MERNILIKLLVDGSDIEMWRSAASTMPAERVASLMPELWELAHDAFPMTAALATDEDLVHHYLAPTLVAYQFFSGRLLAMTAAEVFDLKLGRTLYFSLSDIHSSLRGGGLYEQMLLLRVAIGRNAGCQWWATRTQSPIVAHTFARYGCYPWLDDAATLNVAVEVADFLYERFAVFGRREGEGFDPTTGVLRRAYPLNPYRTIPAVDNVRVQTHFDSHVDRDMGDALLLVGRLDKMIESLAPRCDARFGMPFDQFCELLEDL